MEETDNAENSSIFVTLCNLDRASATISLHPGIYSPLTSYLVNRSINLWHLSAASIMSFLLIIESVVYDQFVPSVSNHK